MSDNRFDELGESARLAPQPASITAKQAAATLALVQSTDGGTSREACLKCGNVASFANDYNAAPFILRVRPCEPCGDAYLGAQLTHHRLLKPGMAIPRFHPPIKTDVLATCTICERFTRRLKLNTFLERQQLLLNCPQCFPHSPAEKTIFRVVLAPKED